MPASSPSPLAVTLRVLRESKGWPQGRLAAALGMRAKDLCALEKGHLPLDREKLERLIVPMGLGAEAIDSTLFWLETGGFEVAGPAGSPFELDPRERRRILEAAVTAGWTVVKTVSALLAEESRSAKAGQARSRARRLWRRLRSFAPEDRRRLVEAAEEYRSWSMVEVVCEASARAAADDPARALELADLARFIADRAAGGEVWRQRLQGYALAFLGNAQRVAGDLRGAELTFAQSRALWEAGAASDPGVLDASRVLDLEASLRRAQRRFSEAIELLDQALVGKTGPACAGRILLKKAFTYEQMGDCEGAIAALEQAAPLVDGKCEPRQLCVLRFNLAVNLCHLERYAEAAPLVAEVRELAIALRNDLDLQRVLWLEARVSAGLGRRAEAVGALRQVRDDFAARGLSYDAALVSLNLAVLLLEEGRIAEVRALAPEMLPIFESLGIGREALAALSLFFQATGQAAATADLGRRLLRFLERARYDTELRFGSDAAPAVEPRSPDPSEWGFDQRLQ
jgi:tetratricopeptide (TPR) repeat protein